VHASAVLRHSQFAKIAALPGQLQLESILGYTHDGLFEHGAQNVAAAVGTRGSMRVGALEVGS